MGLSCSLHIEVPLSGLDAFHRSALDSYTETLRLGEAAMKKEYRRMQRKANGKIREIADGMVTMEMPLPLAAVLMGMPQVIRELAEDSKLVGQ